MVTVVMIGVVTVVMIGVVIMAVIGVVVMVPMAVSVIILGDALLKPGPFREEQSLLHGEVSLQRGNLTLDFGHGVLNSFGGDDAQWIERRNQVVVGLPELTIIAGVARGPIELLRIDLNAQGFC